MRLFLEAPNSNWIPQDFPNPLNRVANFSFRGEEKLK